MAEQVSVDTQRDGRADFDFLIGAWDSRQRKLKHILKGCDEWEEFHAVSVARKILGGLGNFDEVTLEKPGGHVLGATLRLFDPQTQLWRIYWSSSSRTVLDPPMVGRFEQGRGEFYDQELFEGRPVFSRFIWTSSGADACHWEQAFSADGGRTWETNWTMDLTRRKDTNVAEE